MTGGKVAKTEVLHLTISSTKTKKTRNVGGRVAGNVTIWNISVLSSTCPPTLLRLFLSEMRNLLLIAVLVSTVFSIFKPPDHKKLFAKDHFFFNVTLVCLVHDWKYKVQFFETDGWLWVVYCIIRSLFCFSSSSNDRLTHAYYARGFQGQNNFHIEGYMRGDEMSSDVSSPPFGSTRKHPFPGIQPHDGRRPQLYDTRKSGSSSERAHPAVL